MKKYKVLRDVPGLVEEGQIVTLSELIPFNKVMSKYKDDEGNEYPLFNEQSSKCQVELIEYEEVAPLENSDQSSYYDAIKELYKNNYNLFLEKNRKYGNSFQDTFTELGRISALTRMNDKFNRIKTMMLSNELDNEESLVDSLLDLSNYALMTVYELQQKEV